MVCLVSGGVDSAVCAAMLQKAIGKEKIIPVHIDNGFMRLNESKMVEKSLSEIGIHLEVFNESLNFSTATTRLPQKVGLLIHHYFPFTIIPWIILLDLFCQSEPTNFRLPNSAI